MESIFVTPCYYLTSTYYCGNIIRLGVNLPGETDPVRKGIGNL